jgi:hypothetical protein
MVILIPKGGTSQHLSFVQELAWIKQDKMSVPTAFFIVGNIEWFRKR